MGIRGLTTYVEQRSDQLFETFQLKDCSLVIDGNSLVAQLYQRVYKAHSAFGGDYDAYADSVRHFFNVLRKCNVIPFILLDGGYEVKKLKTVKSRFQTRICDARKVSPLVQMKRSVFPLMLIAVFKEVVFEMGIKLVQCGFEADHEIAAVARAMKCPVISYDSDFYIYDVLYIPFDTFSLEAVEIGVSPEGTKLYAIDCKVYKVENFLMSFGGLDKTVLPLMATVLGNDYIQKNVFQNFFSKIKHPKSHTSSDTQRHIVGLLTWLRGKTPDEAVAMVSL
ncbi:protein asteroid isoform X2 [Bacillus rossius redtenbacheri]|uniref:protein asteroid isoform X2 n=1 Tax=Bacillus rossius redtenbacheri TaxID=93214 RepID=UPI002FDDE075